MSHGLLSLFPQLLSFFFFFWTRWWKRICVEGAPVRKVPGGLWFCPAVVYHRTSEVGFGGGEED